MLLVGHRKKKKRERERNTKRVVFLFTFSPLVLLPLLLLIEHRAGRSAVSPFTIHVAHGAVWVTPASGRCWQLRTGTIWKWEQNHIAFYLIAFLLCATPSRLSCLLHHHHHLFFFICSSICVLLSHLFLVHFPISPAVVHSALVASIYTCTFYTLFWCRLHTLLHLLKHKLYATANGVAWPRVYVRTKKTSHCGIYEVSQYTYFVVVVLFPCSPWEVNSK